MTLRTLALLGSALFAVPAAAQDHSQHGTPTPPPHPEQPAPTPAPEAAAPAAMDHSQMDHAAMDHGAMDHGAMDHGMMDHGAMDHGAGPLPFAEGSGTARLPGNEGAMHGLMLSQGEWMVMAHGYLQANYTDHSGPRGDAMPYVTSMAMLSAETAPDWGRFQARTMMSLEPLMDAKGYPNLFATGETADGVPLVDRQHPHDLFMELAARLDVNLGSADHRLFLYGGPVGEPALGPSAFMHRGSARLNPEPPITHHWFDSTHITYGVVTAGYSGTLAQVEASAFRGREPDEDRWDIERPRLDSWAVRGTVTPSPALAFQASYGELASPEASHPDEDERRFTASAHYAGTNGLSAMLAFSSKQHVAGHDGADHAGAGHPDEPALTAWLAEASWDVTKADTVFARFENVANDELFPDPAHPLHDQRFRVSKVQLGYARSFDVGAARMALGASGALYAKPDALTPYYGDTPFGFTLFARIALGH